jgi:hypothetical protein
MTSLTERMPYTDQRQVEWHLKHPSFVNWKAMVQRCQNKNHSHYPSYGGRGIAIHSAWRVFKVYEQEFGYLKPGPGYTVDRINNDGNYEPGNVQWLTKQANYSKDN